MCHDDGGVGAAKNSASSTPVWPKPVVTLQAGQDQIEIFRLDRGGEGARGRERIEFEEIRVGNVDAAVSAFCERFLNGLLGAFGTHGDGHHFAAVFFFQAQGFFECEGVRLVGFEADIGFANPRAAFENGERSVFRGNLFDANCDFQECLRKRAMRTI